MQGAVTPLPHPPKDAAGEGALDAMLRESAFLRRGGCVVLRSLLSPEFRRALTAEATAMAASARRTVWGGTPGAEWRGGDPARAYGSCSGGPVQTSIFALPALADALSGVAELPLVLAGAGSYSYYHQAGDFLALHRDIVRCDVALLTCLRDKTAAGRSRGTLRIYPSFAHEPLSVLRATADPGGADIMLAPGETVLLMGGIVPHEVLPMVPGQQRTMSVLCFRVQS
jgi:hypothetical protein